MEDSIITLPIDQEIRQRLVLLLEEFNSHRVLSTKKVKTINGNSVGDKKGKIISLEKHKEDSISRRERIKSKSLSFFEKLFITEYSA